MKTLTRIEDLGIKGVPCIYIYIYTHFLTSVDSFRVCREVDELQVKIFFGKFAVGHLYQQTAICLKVY